MDAEDFNIRTTDRHKPRLGDIVVKVLAAGDSASSAKVGDLAQGEPITIRADDSVDDAVKTMMEHNIRRLPVVEGDSLVGMISQADIARNIDEKRAGEFLRDISEAP